MLIGLAVRPYDFYGNKSVLKQLLITIQSKLMIEIVKIDLVNV